jgi:polar amino acid transport system substrate-binding protein
MGPAQLGWRVWLRVLPPKSKGRLMGLLGLIGTACLASALALTAHSAPLRITGSHDPSDPLIASSKAVIAQAYAQLNQAITFVDVPPRRALVLLLSGEVDGNLQRVFELSHEQPSLVRVDTPINRMAVRVYALKADRLMDNWSHLSGLRVAYRRGVLALERGVPTGAVRIEARTDAELFRILAAGHADVVLTAEPDDGAQHPSALKVGAVRLDAVLQLVPMYHYLSRAHVGLATRLNSVLLAMQASGEYHALRQRALQLFAQTYLPENASARARK